MVMTMTVMIFEHYVRTLEGHLMTMMTMIPGESDTWTPSWLLLTHLWLQCTGDSAIHTEQVLYTVRHVKATNKCDIVGVGGKDGNNNKKHKLAE